MSFGSKLLCFMIFFGVAKMKCMEAEQQLHMKLHVPCKLSSSEVSLLKDLGIEIPKDVRSTSSNPRKVPVVNTSQGGSNSLMTYEYQLSIESNEYIKDLFEFEIYSNNFFAIFPKYETVNAVVRKSDNIETFLKVFYYKSLKLNYANVIFCSLNHVNSPLLYLPDQSKQLWQNIFYMVAGEKRAENSISNLSSQVLHLVGMTVAIIEFVGFMTFDSRKAHDATCLILFLGLTMAWLCKN